MRDYKRFVIFTILFIINFSLFSQEALLSEEENFYDFLSLSNYIDRPYINYRTLSDSNWNIDNLTEDQNFWSQNQLSTNFTFYDFLQTKIYNPQWYSSINTQTPYGQNDGGLWQGKGYNSSLEGGVRLESFGVELTFKPQLSFSQNLNYLYPSRSYMQIDVPQRFGNKPFFNFDWGDSEIRYTWKNLTIGFGTQAIWLGPAKVNPIIHSNNAASYPKFDFGIRKQSINIKDIWFGNIEARYWMGQLSESDYFDSNPLNDKNLITGLALGYEIPFLPGLRIGVNRTMLSAWNDVFPYNKNTNYCLWELLVPYMKNAAGYDKSDQRASVTADYFIPKGGIDIYLEWAKNDYNSGLDNLLRYPFHTQALTGGFKKVINYEKTPQLHGEFIFELSFIESSMDYHFFYDWGGGGNYFYTHHIITQGYTNGGQYLGAGIGSGGNSQYVSYKLYYPKGYFSFFVQRLNPDLNYFYFVAPRDGSDNQNHKVKESISVNLDFGISALYYITPSLRTSLSFIMNDQHNPMLYNTNNDNEFTAKKSVHRYNFVTQFNIKYYF